MSSPDSLEAYSSKRSRDYESINHRQNPQQQRELVDLAQSIEREFADRVVLEVACGTGYWTEFLSKLARSVTATDVSPEVLDVARSKRLDPRQSLI